MNKFAFFALAIFAILASTVSAADKRNGFRRLQTAAPVAVVPVAVVTPVAAPVASKGSKGAGSSKGTKRMLVHYSTPYEG